jgi:hypothetical protein
MKLTDLNPEFVGHGGDEMSDLQGNPIPRREGVAISFDCPCGGVWCGQRPMIFLNPPMDGGATLPGTTTWKRTGDTFETMTLAPSIQRMSSCRWHGFITDGEIVNA